MTDHVRVAGLPELDKLVPLFDAYRQFYGAPADLVVARAFLAARMSRNESIVLLAEDSGSDAIGFVQLYPGFCSLRAAPIQVLNDLFVSPAARGRGVGALLLRTAAEQARSAGAVHLTLSTAVTNLAAQSLYEAMGWKRNDDFYEYNLRIQ